LALGIVLITLLYGNRTAHREYKVASALQAAGIAKQHIPEGWILLTLQKIELQPGVGDSDKTLPVWVVALSLQKEHPSTDGSDLGHRDRSKMAGTSDVSKMPGTCGRNCRFHCYCRAVAPAPPTRDTLSLFIDATTGQVVTIP
jgi:hypothetical protein